MCEGVKGGPSSIVLTDTNMPIDSTAAVVAVVAVAIVTAAIVVVLLNLRSLLNECQLSSSQSLSQCLLGVIRGKVRHS